MSAITTSNYSRAAETPNYVKAVNTVSAGLWNAVFSSTLVASGIGAAAGYRYEKPFTYGLQLTLIDLFWKYVVPRTFGKLFFHLDSNAQAQNMGVVLSLLTSCLIPTLFKRIVSLIAKDTPYVGKLAEEAEKEGPDFRLGALASVVIGIIKLGEIYNNRYRLYVRITSLER